MRWAVLVVLLAAAGARAEERPLFKWERPRAWEAVPLGIATALIWVDVLQTLDWQRRGWPTAETNPTLGPHPSRARIVWEGGVLPSLLLAALWYVLPYAWRTLPCGAAIGLEANTILMNSANGLTIRF